MSYQPLGDSIKVIFSIFVVMFDSSNHQGKICLINYRKSNKPTTLEITTAHVLQHEKDRLLTPDLPNNYMMTSPAIQRRVVVTGIGAITPLGQTFQSTWNNLIDNTSHQDASVGATTMNEALELQNLPTELMSVEQPMIPLLPSQVASPVRDVPYDARTSRFIQLCLRAGGEAIQHANLSTWLGYEQSNPEHDATTQNSISEKEYERRRIRSGTCIGSSASGVREIVSMYASITKQKSIRRLSPISIPKLLPNSAAGQLSLEFKLRGPTLSPATACAAGAHAIGDAMRCIQYNDADIMLAGKITSRNIILDLIY